MRFLTTIVLFALFIANTAAKEAQATKKEEKRKPNAVEDSGGNGPISVSCDDGKGNIQLMNVIEIQYSEKSNFAIASGFGAGAGSERHGVHLKGLCQITYNRGFNPNP